MVGIPPRSYILLLDMPPFTRVRKPIFASDSIKVNAQNPAERSIKVDDQAQPGERPMTSGMRRATGGVSAPGTGGETIKDCRSDYAGGQQVIRIARARGAYVTAPGLTA